jgi:hypothetical protein
MPTVKMPDSVPKPYSRTTTPGSAKVSPEFSFETRAVVLNFLGMVPKEPEALNLSTSSTSSAGSDTRKHIPSPYKNAAKEYKKLYKSSVNNQQFERQRSANLEIAKSELTRKNLAKLDYSWQSESSTDGFFHSQINDAVTRISEDVSYSAGPEEVADSVSGGTMGRAMASQYISDEDEDSMYDHVDSGMSRSTSATRPSFIDLEPQIGISPQRPASAPSYPVAVSQMGSGRVVDRDSETEYRVPVEIEDDGGLDSIPEGQMVEDYLPSVSRQISGASVVSLGSEAESDVSLPVSRNLSSTGSLQGRVDIQQTDISPMVRAHAITPVAPLLKEELEHEREEMEHEREELAKSSRQSFMSILHLPGRSSQGF